MSQKQGSAQKQMRPKLTKTQKKKARKQIRAAKARTFTKVNNALSRVVAAPEGSILARQMAIPTDVTNYCRMPTVDMPKTAIFKLTTTASVTTPNLGSVQSPVGSSDGDLMFYIYGLPGLSAMYGPAITPAVVTAVTATYAYQDNTTFQLVTGPMAATDDITVDWKPYRCTENATSEYIPLGMSRSKVFAWFNDTEDAQFYYMQNGTSQTTCTTGLYIEMLRWEGPGELVSRNVNITKATGASAPFAIPVTTSGWYSFEVTFRASVATTGTVGFTIQNTARIVNPPRMKFLYQSALVNKEIGESIRRTGFSLLVTNTSAMINRQGNVIAARLMNDGFLTDNAFGMSHLSGAAEKYTGDASKGVYTYMDFDQNAEVFSQSLLNDFGTSGPAGPVFNLEYYGYVHTIRISNPSPSVTPNSYLVTACGLYESKTDSMMFTKTVPLYSHDALVEARRVNNATEYFYENPLHIADIWRYIRGAFNQFRKAAVPIGTAASALFPEAAGVIMPAAHMLQT